MLLNREHPHFDLAMELVATLFRGEVRVRQLRQDFGFKNYADLKQALRPLQEARVRFQFRNRLKTGRVIEVLDPIPAKLEQQAEAYFADVYGM
jgi:hypothetical protein